MKKFYDVIYEFALRGYVITLFEGRSIDDILAITVIHDDATYLGADEKEYLFWRAGLPTVKFVAMNNTNLYPKAEEIKFFTISCNYKTSSKFVFNEATFGDDLFEAAKTI